MRIVLITMEILALLIFPKISYAYPVFAQQAYESPRGRDELDRQVIARRRMLISLRPAVWWRHSFIIAGEFVGDIFAAPNIDADLTDIFGYSVH